MRTIYVCVGAIVAIVSSWLISQWIVLAIAVVTCGIAAYCVAPKRTITAVDGSWDITK